MVVYSNHKHEYASNILVADKKDWWCQRFWNKTPKFTGTVECSSSWTD